MNCSSEKTAVDGPLVMLWVFPVCETILAFG